MNSERTEENGKRGGGKERERKMAVVLGSIVDSIKTKVMKTLKKKKKSKVYARMDKSSSMKLKIRSLQAQRLIDQTLKAADRPGKISISS
ncbi:hypothetical protein COCNU_05G000510 [Cocos nucifera]|uniref:Uncharacterized protein n=1 Tax=Cocos nucifera TaxID=13894 RepID=A0A8K0I793_COCNU|nr:hypothetical protein COCNU_05G000510 [Cocos nucifera]